MEILEKAKFIFEEYKYRHELYWKLFFQFVYAILFLFAVFFFNILNIASERLSGSHITYLFAGALIILGITSTFIMINEYYRLKCVGEVFTSRKKDMDLFHSLNELDIKFFPEVIRHSSITYPLMNFAPLCLSIIFTVILVWSYT